MLHCKESADTKFPADVNLICGKAPARPTVLGEMIKDTSYIFTKPQMFNSINTIGHDPEPGSLLSILPLNPSKMQIQNLFITASTQRTIDLIVFYII
jgi:hypothetical protein